MPSFSVYMSYKCVFNCDGFYYGQTRSYHDNCSILYKLDGKEGTISLGLVTESLFGFRLFLVYIYQNNF